MRLTARSNFSPPEGVGWRVAERIDQLPGKRSGIRRHLQSHPPAGDAGRLDRCDDGSQLAARVGGNEQLAIQGLPEVREDVPDEAFVRFGEDELFYRVVGQARPTCIRLEQFRVVAVRQADLRQLAVVSSDLSDNVDLVLEVGGKYLLGPVRVPDSTLQACPQPGLVGVHRYGELGRDVLVDVDPNIRQFLGRVHRDKLSYKRLLRLRVDPGREGAADGHRSS